MQITPHIHALRIPFQIHTPAGILERFVYAFLVYGERVSLIDTGVAGSEQIIFDYLRESGRAPEEIALIVLTHAHPDHIGAAQAIQRVAGCPVAAHPNERAWIEDVELQARERPVPGFHSLVGGSVQVDQLLEDGDVLSLDGLHVEIAHTPGHSRGSISLLLHEDRALISGDAIPLPGDMPIYDDPLVTVHSISKLRGVAGLSVLLSSWDAPRGGADAYRVMDDGIAYLQRIHQAVRNIENAALLEPMALCARVLSELGMPPQMGNPLIARSFMANLAARDCRDLLQEV
ncbi:MAG: MBL fold metallo-hydrolase [Armatimonadota bacterium]